MFEYTKGSIEWISLGSLRFNRALKQVIEYRSPDSELLNGELLLDPVDNKMRYSDKIRIDVFQKMVKWIRNIDKDVIIYLCMEPEEIWKKVFKSTDAKIQRKRGIDFYN